MRGDIERLDDRRGRASGSRRQGERLVTPRRVVLSLLLAVAGAGLVFAFQGHEETAPVRFSDQAVEGVFPKPGVTVLRQDRIGVDLARGYTGELRVDTYDIPRDQTIRIEPLNQIFFTPGPGTATGALAPGRRCATAVFWKESDGADSSRRYTWCFNVS